MSFFESALLPVTSKKAPAPRCQPEHRCWRHRLHPAPRASLLPRGHLKRRAISFCSQCGVRSICLAGLQCWKWKDWRHTHCAGIQGGGLLCLLVTTCGAEKGQQWPLHADHIGSCSVPCVPIYGTFLVVSSASCTIQWKDNGVRLTPQSASEA